MKKETRGKKPGKMMGREMQAVRNQNIMKDLKSMSFADAAKSYKMSEQSIRNIYHKEKEKEVVPVIVRHEPEVPVGAVAAKLLAQDQPVEEIVKQPEGTPIKKLGKIFITIDVQYEEVAIS